MRVSWKLVALITAVAVVACTKEWPGRKTAAARNNGKPQPVYASEWTTISQWQKDQQGFFAEQAMGAPAQKGKLLLFARNLWQADSGYNGEDIPLQLPLQFLPYTNQPGLTETWQYELQGDKLRVNLAVAGAANAQPRDVAVRYVVIPEKIWEELAAATTDSTSMAYDDLVARLDLKP